MSTPAKRTRTKSKKRTLSSDELARLETIFADDLDLLLFYVTWLKHGLNAGKAYQELHPEVTYGSARTLGSKLLTKIDKHVLMEAYGLDLQRYMQQLTDGLAATKRDQFTGELQDDHATRKPYHDKLGKLLGLETDALPPVAIQINFNRGE